MKIVVFDLDETLGYFTEFGIFWDSLSQYLKTNKKQALSQTDFDDILDLYPEFLRPNIINILNYLKNKKVCNSCHKMLIYTNNNGPKEWAQHIISYFEKKIDYKIIDQVISAFKINGKVIEIGRTSHNKSHNDLVRCSKIPLNAEICFLDDTFYPEMANENVYYINVKPYYYDLKFEDMLEKFINSDVGKKMVDKDFEQDIMSTIKLYKYECLEKNEKEYEVDKILGKHIITHLQEFFSKSKKNKTLKNTGKKRNKTYKNR